MSDSFGSSGSDGGAALATFMGGAFLCWMLFILLMIVATVFVYYKVFEKPGNSGWMDLLMLVPIVNLGMFLFLAFSDWPVLRENRDLKARLGYPPQGYPPPGAYVPTPPAYYPQQPVSPQAPSYAGQPPAPQVYPPQPPAQPQQPPEQPPQPPMQPPAQP